MFKRSSVPFLPGEKVSFKVVCLNLYDSIPTLNCPVGLGTENALEVCNTSNPNANCKVVRNMLADTHDSRRGLYGENLM